MKKTPYQLRILEECYRVSVHPWRRRGGNNSLLESIGLNRDQVTSWFSRRRNKDKKQRIKRPKHYTFLESFTRSGTADKSESSSSNQPLEAANILGQIASQKFLPHTLTPMEMESRNEKDVTTEGASHVDSLPVVNASGGREHGSPSKSNLPSSSDLDASQLKEPVVDPVRGSGDDVDGDGDDAEIKSKMINMLVEKNKKDKAKCQSLLDEISLLEKSIEDRDKLIDDIKKVR